ncbi:MAG: leucine--tRNA ligase, partial [Proteobacteria bacterium]|nr:leucine--tRNA ligase [Pseudomonadota bacterium]
MSHPTSYPFAEIEPRLQRRWESEDRYSAREDSDREKFYCLAMFPYPSGRLHMGHVRNYTIADAIARYQRQLGKNVLHPIGWDAFGLPAENAANERGADPREWTRRNISTMRVQLQRMGMSYDWHRELTTCDSAYYRWEQWFFARLHKKGLVYRRYSEVNWDPVDQTVLANEQVVDGCGWRSGAPVEKRSIAQWFVRISAYAEELLAGLDTLEHWPAQVVQMQRNWIGRSEGSEISFALTAGDTRLTAFTTRADTLFGVVALVLSPGHALVEECARTDRALAEAVEHMRAAAAAAGTDAAATATATKLGHRLAVEVIHPLSGERLPVYVGNYVLSEYGSGVVMLVPAHDQRDFEFARQYGLPVRAVVLPEDGSLSTRTQDWSKAWTGLGVLTASERFDGMPAAVAAVEITRELARRGQGQSAVAWRLRDWGVSRQRYWGCPIPVVYDENDQPRISEDIPVELPAVQPSDGQSLLRLADHPDFATDRRPRRETDTLDTFFESSWYYARFCCPDFDEGMLDNRARYWLPVDQYVGGIEHAVLHLLYFRFFHRLMRDEGLVDGDEPVKRLLTQGMVIAHTWSIVDDSGRKQWVAANEVSAKRDDRGAVTSAVHRTSAKPAQYEGLHKMSKSKNNGVDPDA